MDDQWLTYQRIATLMEGYGLDVISALTEANLDHEGPRLKRPHMISSAELDVENKSKLSGSKLRACA